MRLPNARIATVTHVPSGACSRWLGLLGAVALAILLSTACLSHARPADGKTFASPADAVLALYNAAKSQDDQALSSIFGSHANELLHTGDDVVDRNMAENFVLRYEEMHRLVIEPDNKATLYIGAENWPFPIPIVKDASGTWVFDSEAGEKEVLYRRVGRKENDAIENPAFPR
jgi:hypothetical protein